MDDDAGVNDRYPLFSGKRQKEKIPMFSQNQQNFFLLFYFFSLVFLKNSGKNFTPTPSYAS